ncbi:MAG: hypothetical protein U0934_09675 [Pseudotabrizicola sp.]|uniref:hypothetical protein n=1 Tax=Pseudotabrizicola sp. TaxID=2939647 RepID=UPI0027207DA7|nr:hypothetical protein [Pseudotabrizicola sp.]MDO8882858.1 hypothetical protein [Pseudotabrizicola sp.]MDP2082459.1 hypothetical protein [Pseudotabrizicola sp.]MDZ7574212.1 hypothetical protein [Pseudotabrizicola sp.]
MFAVSTAISSSMPRETTRPIRRIITVITAAAAALALMTATALPARADRSSDNLAKALVAAVAIGAIVHSIDKGRAKPAPVPQPPVQARSPRVPSVCAIEISGARRDVTVFPERCLRREGFDYRLPRHCANNARVFGRVDRVYSEDCLRNAGFRVESGRGHDRGFRDHGRGHGRDYGRGRPRHAY